MPWMQEYISTEPVLPSYHEFYTECILATQLWRYRLTGSQLHCALTITQNASSIHGMHLKTGKLSYIVLQSMPKLGVINNKNILKATNIMQMADLV